MKNERHELILRLIQEEQIGTQEDLRARLRENGYDVTQATVSRDIRSLHLVKKANAGTTDGYHYQQPRPIDGISGTLADNIVDMDHAGNILVLRCRSGTAQAVCAMIDTLDYSGIVGTIAGDDTIFVLLRDPRRATRTFADLQDILRNG